MKIFEKIKKTLPGIYPRNKCTKFQKNPTIFGLSTLPQRFWPKFGLKCSPGPQNENFEKIKKKHPRYLATQGTSVPNFSKIKKCLGPLTLPRRFWPKMVPRGPQNENFEKMKKTPQGILPKEQVYQISAKHFLGSLHCNKVLCAHT